jgi:adenosine kinase
MEPEHIRNGLAGARVLLGNDYEFAMMARKLEISEAELIASTPITVVTRGEEGSTIYTSATNGRGVHIPAVPIRDVLDPTGAGDAYVAGLIYGIAHDLPLEVSGRIAALAAAYAIENRGCQEHSYEPTNFVTRYTEAFGAEPIISRMFAPTA